MVIEMADMSMQSPKGIVENVLVKINKFIFPVDLVNLDIVEDNKVSIILGRPMLATALARINVFGRKISLEVGTERVVFNANKGKTPLSVLIPDFDDEVGIRLENLEEGIEKIWDAQDPEITREINPQLRPQFLRFGNRIHHQNPLSRACYNKIMSQELVYTGNNFLGMAKNLYVFVGCPTFLIDFIILEDVSEFIKKGLTEVLFGKPFKECVGLEVDATEGILWVKIVNDKTIFNMSQAFNKFSKLTTKQHNKMAPILRTSKEDKARGIYHPYQKIKEFYKGCLHLGEEYKRDEEVIDWIKRGHTSIHETT
ncbi:homeodomain-like protein [Tanacetum coccineum]